MRAWIGVTLVGAALTLLNIGLAAGRARGRTAACRHRGAADLLNGASRVTLLCGAGCGGAHDQLLALGEKLKSPMVYALKGKEHVECDNPYVVGITGLIGFTSGYYAMNDCDALRMLGTDFPYRQSYRGETPASPKST